MNIQISLLLLHAIFKTQKTADLVGNYYKPR